MSKKDKFIERMRYWCEQANLGYDQSQRWDIRVGGECDCSSLVYWCLWEAGYLAKPAGNLYDRTLYTGTLRNDLLKAGWTIHANDGNPQPGWVVLNDVNHVAVCTGANGRLSMASIDERGRASGGQSGDQTDLETKTRSYYNYPWNCYLVPPSEESRMGWKQNSIGWWYEHADGSYTMSNWEFIDNYWYYFNASGYAVTGWQKIWTHSTQREEWYYFCRNTDNAAPECAMLANGPYWIENGWFAFNTEGHMMHEVRTDGRGAMIFNF